MEKTAKKSSIFLIGFMGAGKSTIGKKLAHRLGLTYFDLDKLIEAKAGCSISDIFKFLGETTFREMEQACLQSFQTRDHFLLSCGGGTPCFYDSISFMKNQGLVVYVTLQESVLFERLSKAKKIRPSIVGMDEKQLKEFISHQLKTRMPFYEQADLTMSGLSFNVSAIVEKIEKFNN